jgi:chemotaxis protein methyltransferase CheR
MMNLIPFRRLLEKKCGLVFENEKSALLETGIRTRMEARSISSPERYLSLLTAERSEFTELIDLLTINETYFYREPVHFTLLAGRVVPELLMHGARPGKLTLLSAGCSTGEEAYSILISLAERYGREATRGFTVIGVDIDTSAVSRAREGVFGRRSFRDFPDDLLRKYFEETAPGTWRVREWLRESICFFPLNLLGGEYPPEVRSVDVIMYRNVSIYFSQDVRNLIFFRLAGILRNGGYLFTSPSETFFYNKGILSLVPLEGAFLFMKGAARQGGENRRPCRGTRQAAEEKPASPAVSPAKSVTAASGPDAAAKAPLPSTGDARQVASFEKAARHAAAREYEESLQELTGVIEDSPGFLPAHTLKGSILMNLSRLDEARDAYREAQKVDRFCLDASFSLGLIERLRRDDQSAIRSLREAVYIHPSCWPAHYFLAETHRERGEAEHARREYEVILKILDKGDFLEHGLTTLPFSFSVRELETLCRRMLQLVKRVGNGA